MQPATALGKKHYALLGKLLAIKHPEVASKLMMDWFPKSEPFEKDYSRIRNYYILFCQVENLQPEEFLGPLYKSHKVDRRRHFISVLLHLYHPEVHSQPIGSPLIGYGFCNSIAQVMGVTRTCVHNMVQKVVDWEKRYDDYKSKVSSMTEKIKELSYAGA